MKRGYGIIGWVTNQPDEKQFDFLINLLQEALEEQNEITRI